MLNNFKNLKIFIRDVIFVSRLTGTKNKKVRVLYSIVLLFITFICDLTVIVTIASLFQENISSNNFIVMFLNKNLYFLPIIVVIRQIALYLDVLNSFSLRFEVEENLRVFLLREVFNKGNYSIGDAYHFLNSFALSVGAFYYSITAFLTSIIQLFLYAGYLIFTDSKTLFVIFGGALFLYWPTKYLTKKGRRYAHIDWEAAREYNNTLQKILENIFLIKLLKKIEDELNIFRNTLKIYYGASLNNQKVGTLTSSFPQFATFFLLSVLLAFFNFAKILTLDFIGILIRLFQEFSRVNKNIMLVSNNHVVLSKLYELIENSSKINYDNFIVEPNNNFALKVKNVDFKYFGAENKIFENISFEIPKFTHTVITGPNGSGKSTMLGLVSGLIFADNGSVTASSNRFGYVGVIPLIVKGNLRENLLYGNENHVSDKILYSYIEEFRVFNSDSEKDLNKIISSKTLSSGQLQKISFIRSLLNEPDILLLDESTSNLDVESKNLIFEILKNLKVTILNATHNHQDFKEVDLHLKILIEDNKRIIKLENYK